MAERELIEYITSLTGRGGPPWLKVGIGDDAAVVRLPAGREVVVTTDMLIEGTHFKPGTPPEAIGWKAVARCLSDVAAMAAKPLCLVAAVSFGKGAERRFCRRLSRAIWQAARDLSAPLVGGDISSGTDVLTIAVTAFGTPGPRGVVTRSGAEPGDAICVTGALGGSLCGRHLTFRPRIREALNLASRFDLHAMIDISDGLSTDLLHIAEQSKTGVVLYADRIPVHPDAGRSGSKGALRDRALHHALNDGEDYELVFCLPPEQAEEAARSGSLDTCVTIIGKITRRRTYNIVMPDGSRHKLWSGGWEHLKRLK
jgi:thiamine-monophosphate kinase